MIAFKTVTNRLEVWDLILQILGSEEWLICLDLVTPGTFLGPPLKSLFKEFPRMKKVKLKKPKEVIFHFQPSLKSQHQLKEWWRRRYYFIHWNYKRYIKVSCFKGVERYSEVGPLSWQECRRSGWNLDQPLCTQGFCICNHPVWDLLWNA